MTTVINTPPNVETVDSGAGWAVAVLILIAIIAVGAYFWVHYHRLGSTTSGGTNINVTLPSVPTQGATPATQ